MRVTAPQQALDDFELYSAEPDVTGLTGSLHVQQRPRTDGAASL